MLQQSKPVTRKPVEEAQNIEELDLNVPQAYQRGQGQSEHSSDIEVQEARRIYEDDSEEEIAVDEDGQAAPLNFTDMQDKFLEIVDADEIEDVMDLNEKFLSMALGGIDATDLAMLPKIELRVDTQQHSL